MAQPPVRARRARGEGSVFQRKDGLWAAQISLPGDCRERRRRLTVYGTSRQQAVDKLAAARKSVLLGVHPNPDRVTFAQLASDWLDTMRPRIRFKSWENYEVALRVHALPAIGRIPVSALHQRDLQTLYKNMLRDGYATASVTKLHFVLHNVEQLTESVDFGQRQ